LELLHRGRDEGMVDADGGRADAPAGDAQTLGDVRPQRVLRLGAEPAHALVRVVGVERGEVHHRDGAQQPTRLVLALDRTALGQRRDPTFERRAVDGAHCLQPAEIERHAGIAGNLAPRRVAIGLARADSGAGKGVHARAGEGWLWLGVHTQGPGSLAGPFGRFEATRGPQWHYPSLPGRTQARPCRQPTRERYSASRGRIPLTAAGDMNDETRAGGSGALMAERIERVVVVGAGHGGAEAAAALRQRGFDRQITLVSDEPDLPYQRPPLSKEYIKRPGNPLMLRPQQFFDDNAVRLMLGVRVVSIDRAGRTVQLSTGESLSYDHLVLATGARNRKPPVPGLVHPAIIELRTLADARRIVELIGGWKRVCVIGGGFIGLEAAGLLATMGIAVEVVEMASRLMQRAVSPTISQWFLGFHQGRGNRVHLSTVVKA